MDLVSEVHQCFSSLGITLDNFQVSMAGEKNLIQFDADVSHRKQEKIFAGLTRSGRDRRDASGREAATGMTRSFWSAHCARVRLAK